MKLPKLGQIFTRTKIVFRNVYDGAKLKLLNADWLTSRASADAEIGRDLRTLIDRSRDLERNNEYAVRYGDLVENNVLGSNGVVLQVKATDPNGRLDDLANKTIGTGWLDWGKRENCDVAGKLCWREIEGMILRRAVYDGNGVARMRKGAAFGKYSFQLEIFDVDQLDLDYSTNLASGSYVRFGIEFSPFGRVLAYHIWKKNPGDVYASQGERERVPAEEIIHAFRTERPKQSIGVPWVAPVMQALQDLGKFREAELVAARVSACKGYAIEQSNSDGWDGSKDADGNPLQEMTPGMGMLLRPGEKYVSIDPNHPNQAFGEFNKSALRGIAAGLNTGYMSLANDPSDANYSSMRGSKLEEIEEYKAIQGWLIESLHQRVFENWLTMALAGQSLKLPNGSALPISKFDKFNAPSWKPRRWPWVDPTKDLNAAILSVEKGFKSRQQIIAEMGGDINEVFQEIEADEALAESKGLVFPLGTNPQQPQPVEQSAAAQN